MADARRYAKTEKGTEEIRSRGKNLRGRLRTMLILIDPTKTADELREQGVRVGAPEDFLETLIGEGYIAPLTLAAPASAATDAPVPTSVTSDELARFREAKTFMNETVVAALGIRAFMFTLRLERCSARADLGQLVPDYERALRKGVSEPEARAMADRLRELLADQPVVEAA